MAKRPGGELATRPLHFIWIADCSGSMSVDGKIQSLNTAIREALPHMRAVADENPNAEILVRSLTFGSGAQWQISQPTPVADFKWTDLQTNGLTDMGLRLRMMAEQLQMPSMTDRALPPVLVLVSDGQPTDNFTGELAALGQEGGAHRHCHRRGRRHRRPAALHRPSEGQAAPGQQSRDSGAAQVRHIKLGLSTAVLKFASAPASQAAGLAAGQNVPIPAPPTTPTGPQALDDVW